MLFLLFFVGIVCGIVLPLAPKTLSGWNTTSTATAAEPPPLITASASPALIPSQWVPVPTTVEFPCELEVPYGCVTSIRAYNEDPPNMYHTEGNNFIDPYWNYNRTGIDYEYDTSCGSAWSTSLLAWMRTAPTTLGPELPASEVYSIIIGTTITVTSHSFEYSQSVIFQSISTQSNGVPVYMESDQEVATWSSVTTLTATTTGITSLLSTRSAHRDAYFLSSFTYTAATPCCSSCTLFGGTVQVFQWPTPAPSSPISILVDEKNNFTFTSPSVYVAFQSLYATNLCGTLGDELITSTTIGFMADELSTSQLYTYTSTSNWWNMPWLPYGFTQATWGQISTCGPTTSTFYQALAESATYSLLYDALQYSRTMTEVLAEGDTTTIPFQSYTDEPMIGTYTITFDACQPMLSVPTSLYSLQPLWTGCVPGISAFYDPPYTLSTAGAMGLSAPTGTPNQNQDPPPAVPEQRPKSASEGAKPVPATPAPTHPGQPLPTPKIPAPASPNAPGKVQSKSPPAPDPPTPTPSAYIVAGQTLARGGPAITVSGTVVSLLPGEASVAIAGVKTVPLASYLSSIAAVGGGDGIGYVFASQTLKPGIAVEVDGVVMSLAAGSEGESVVVIQSKTGGGGETVTPEGSAIVPGVGAGGKGSGTQSAAPPAQTATGNASGSENESLNSTSSGNRRLERDERWVWILGVGWGVWVLGAGFL